MSASLPHLATFWHGAQPSSIERACLLSFTRIGFEVTVFTYVDSYSFPWPVKQRNASDIADPSLIDRFFAGQARSLAHFSDYFRYLLFEKENLIWIDSDIICLRPFTVSSEANLIAQQNNRELNNAILYISPKDIRLRQIILRTEGLMDRKGCRWGATGPDLLTEFFANDQNGIRPSGQFFPIQWQQWFRPFLPQYYDFCRESTSSAYALHLWNRFIVESGFWKDIAPPEGSHIHNILLHYDLLYLFKDVLPISVMQRLVDNHAKIQALENQSRRDTVKQLLRRSFQRA